MKNLLPCQSGKYTVNIQQEKDIQIGDRIYQGTDVETIKVVAI